MRFRGLLLITALLSLLACGGGGSSDGSGSSLASQEVTPGVQRVPAGAQQWPPGASTSSPAPSAAPAAEPVTDAAVEPASMIVDLESHRIFLPDEGWLTAEAFWDLYYNHADRLPEGIDFDAVDRLGPMPPAPAAER